MLQVPPGEYRLSAFAAMPENAPELLFSPPFIDVVLNKPLLDVKFYQVRINADTSKMTFFLSVNSWMMIVSILRILRSV